MTDGTLVHTLGGTGRPGASTDLVLRWDGSEQLPSVVWFGCAADGLTGKDVVLAVGQAGHAVSSQGAAGRALPLLPEASQAWLGRPALVGFRLGDPARRGQDWSTAFRTVEVDADETHITVWAADPLAELGLETELEAVPGGALRLRHRVTNFAAQPYVLESLDVVLPVPDRADRLLDLTGRWGRERVPQRREVGDGLWLRETRGGRPGFDSPTLTVLGSAELAFGSGEVWGLHLAWSGGTRHFVERQPSGAVTMGAGELLLSGEIVLGEAESYVTPWVYIVASDRGLDGLAEQLHAFQRALPAHPVRARPVVANVWEAVYFDHNLDTLHELARRAAAVGVERFVLDDGWFGGRRDVHSGLGDWTVSEQVWPDGLSPLIDEVHRLGMDFGLWFEPEMVNPDSDLYRAHPDWVLGVQNRELLQFRHQLVLDLGRSEVRDHLFEQLTAVLSAHPIRYVKWDHNRNLIEAAGATGAPGVHAQTLGFYDLLDRLRAAHPDVEWESCASGGGRIDLGVLERVQRVWTSDMTDALSRQHIQRWTGQLVAPEYLGAHISAPVNHQTGRSLSLDFRAATAFFGDLGVEWDLTQAESDVLDRIGAWISAYKTHRSLLHTGRVTRVDSPVEQVLMYGVVATSRDEAVFSYVQLDEFVSDPPAFQVPGLDPTRSYTATQVGPPTSVSDWRGEGMSLSGAVLAKVGLPAPARRPESAFIVHLQADL